jgi:hypothetical protein
MNQRFLILIYISITTGTVLFNTHRIDLIQKQALYKKNSRQQWPTTLIVKKLNPTQVQIASPSLDYSYQQLKRQPLSKQPFIKSIMIKENTLTIDTGL